MPTIKPHKGLRKRVRLTATGKVMRSKSGRRHLLSVKSANRKRHKRNKQGVSPAEERRIKTLLVER